MKNKFVQYFLLIVVIVIWGVIVMKIYNQMGNNDEIANNVIVPRDTSNNEVVENTYNLTYSGANPFVENVGNELEGMAGEATLEEDMTVEPVKLNWPSIMYMGIVVNNKNLNNQLVLLNIENNEILLKSTDAYKEFKIKKVYKDSIILQYKNEKKTFVKN